MTSIVPKADVLKNTQTRPPLIENLIMRRPRGQNPPSIEILNNFDPDGSCEI